MAYTRYKGDPYWKRAKVDGTSADGTPLPRMAVAPAALSGPRAPPAHKGQAAPMRLPEICPYRS